MVTSRSTFPRGVPRHCDSLHHGRGPINYRPMTKPTTLGELKQTEWASPARIHRTVKDELRENLVCLLENGSPLFPGIVGYEDSVIPQLVNAVLSRHNFILLGLRGQAKSRILRQLVTLLDEEIPILAGSEVNDNPFAPISKYGRERVTEQGAGTPIAWLPRESRFVEKGDVQVKGYPVRLNLDVALVFTANPEDYTARGKIITPLKDRIGSEIVTHYPYTVELGTAITRQEAWLERSGRPLKLPDFVAELIERVAFEAREDKRVDRRSGVSQRLPISVLENVVSNAERRTVTTKEKTVVPRISDIYAALPAITGKLELEYEGELQGPESIAKDLIRRAAGKTFESRVGGANVDDIVHWFDEGGALKISMDERSETCLKGFSVVPGLLDLVDQVGLAAKKDPGTMVAACELVLEGLVAEKRISRNEELGYVRARAEPKGPGYGKTGGGGGGPNLFQ